LNRVARRTERDPLYNAADVAAKYDQTSYVMSCCR
jgi:hypothetical protein